MSPNWADCWRWAAEWSQRWFLDGEGRDRLTMPDGTEGGWATHVEAHAVLLRVALVAAGLETDRAEVPWLVRVKQRGFDRGARAWGLRATRLRRQGPPEINPGGAALMVEIPTPSMMEPAHLVAEQLPEAGRSLAVADPRADLAWRRRGARPAPLLLDLVEQRRALREGAQAARSLLDSLQAAPPTLRFDQQDLTRPALAALRTALDRSLAWLRPESLALRQFLDAAQPRTIAVASDQHRIGRLVVQFAGTTRVVVLQHGLPQASVGYLPVVADTVAVWSDASREWFERHETPRIRLELTGNPRLDALKDQDREGERRTVEERLRLRGAPRLLLALSPVSVERNAAEVRLALDVIEERPQATLVIKLHPGHRAWRFIYHAVRGSPHRQRIRVLHREALGPLLAWADMLLVQRSTVAAEALAAGTPVLLIQPGGVAPPPPHQELDHLSLPCATDAPSAAGMAGDLADPAGHEDYMRKYNERIAWLNGPADGRSAERVARLLLGERRRT